MICQKCNSQNVNIQIVNESHLKRKHHSILYWLFIGWWLELFLWIFLTIPRLLFFLFVPRNKKIVNKQVKMYVCQNCGNSWKAN